MEEEYGDIQIGGFKLDYENPNKKIIDSIDQIDIFALFNDKWTVVKKVAVMMELFISSKKMEQVLVLKRKTQVIPKF